MSATEKDVAEDLVTITIDGAEYKARKGAMVIEVTDENDITVPRFCYHNKLPVAANCRMCMVEVEKAPKPLPACATPVMDGMIIHTQSDYAKNAQRAVMEFLLINHPLDCPICDQGGECELQDVALEYGRGISRFSEQKRVVENKNFGPLIATDMTRCIHCTRCIRFLTHIGGFREIGGIGRGENLEISTYIENSIDSELSGNIIDVCPVGALTSKPFRYSARAWELETTPSISPHDCVGSNLLIHTRQGELKRVVPAENEAVNEVWLSDRDRFSYQGVNSDDRLTEPMIKTSDGWQAVDWETALETVVEGLKLAMAKSAQPINILVSPNATLEEAWLLNRIAEALGTSNIDHRLRQNDFTGQTQTPVYPALGRSIASLDTLDACLVVGGNPRKEQPIIGHRLRTAAQQGAKLMLINPIDYSVTFPVAEKMIATPAKMIASLAAVAAAVQEKTAATPDSSIAELLKNAAPGTTAKQITETLLSANDSAIILGSTALALPGFSALRGLAVYIAEHTDTTLGFLSDGANSAGAHLAGVLPHRTVAGEARETVGKTALEMMQAPADACLLFAVEPERDCANAFAALNNLSDSGFVVSMTPYLTDEIRNYAQVVLPIATTSETSGTFVNCQGDWQSFAAASRAAESVRPGWKVLRVLGNLFDVTDCEYVSSQDVCKELANRVGSADNNMLVSPNETVTSEVDGLQRIGTVSMYAVDSLVRRSPALQQTPDADTSAARLSSVDAKRLGLEDGEKVQLKQDGLVIDAPLVIDDNVAEGAVWFSPPASVSYYAGSTFGSITVKKVN
ncbi:MAG: NADH-quinone oxidoreductase subunit NuoG [Gammaproteobacteria bacterium]